MLNKILIATLMAWTMVAVQAEEAGADPAQAASTKGETAAPAKGDKVTVKTDHPESYVVQKGDTLWDISARFLNEPWLWPQVWEANPQIANPHLIYPGDVVALQYKDGRPILAVRRGGKGDRYQRLSPSVRSYEKTEAIPAIPIDAIKQFLARPLVVEEGEMDGWPYVVSSYDEHLIAGSGNKIYVRGLPADATAERYAVYRKGKAYINPRKDENAILGYEALYLGDAVMEKNGDPASMILARSNREILAGDRLAEESESDSNSNFIPTTPSQEVSGNVISVFDGVSEIGQYQVVVLDLGSSHGIQIGNVVGVYKSGKIVKDLTAAEIREKEEDARRIESPEGQDSVWDEAATDILNDIRDAKRSFDKSDLVGYLGRPGTEPVFVELPEEYSGVLMVFRTFENISYALVMEAVSPIHIYDSVGNL
jgi:hypothetical protein